MGHPYERFEGTPLWSTIESSLDELLGNRDLEFQTHRRYVIGLLCDRLDRANLLNPAATQSPSGIRTKLAAFLEAAATGNRESLEWQEYIATHYPDEEAEHARQQAALTAFRLHRGEISDEKAAQYFRSLAHRLRLPAS